MLSVIENTDTDKFTCNLNECNSDCLYLRAFVASECTRFSVYYGEIILFWLLEIKWKVK